MFNVYRIESGKIAENWWAISMEQCLSRPLRIEPLARHKHLVQQIAVLLNQEWGHLAPWASLSEIQHRFAVQLNAGRAPFTLVALGDDDAFLGTASVKLFELPQHRDKMHWLGEVFIPAELRGRGIGSRLIDACVVESRRLHLSALYLYTPDQQALYARLGWKPIEHDYINGEDISIMHIALGTDPSTSRFVAPTD